MIPTDTDGLLRDAGGARPASDVDALIERLQGFNPPDRTIASQRDYSQAIHDAADALVQLRERIAALEAERDCANDRAATHLADAYSMRDQRDALKVDAERYRWLRKFGEDGTPHIAVEDYIPRLSQQSDFRIRWLYEKEADAAIDAAREKP